MDQSRDINSIREIFSDLGCISEKVNEGYFSLEISLAINYRNIKQTLDELEKSEIIGYAEPCLSQNHSQQL